MVAYLSCYLPPCIVCVCWICLLKGFASQDDFEAKYNFRFQEEGGGEIKSYARNVMSTFTVCPVSTFNLSLGLIFNIPTSWLAHHRCKDHFVDKMTTGRKRERYDVLGEAAACVLRFVLLVDTYVSLYVHPLRSLHT